MEHWRLELEPSSNTTTTANADHRSLLRATKKKTRTRFYECKSSCFNRDDKKRCQKKCTVKRKINRAFCLNSHVPKMCRGCCEREDDTDTNPGPGPDSTPDLPTDPPLVGCLEVCSNTNPKMKCDPTECSLCKRVENMIAERNVDPTVIAFSRTDVANALMESVDLHLHHPPRRHQPSITDVTTNVSS